MQAIQVKSFLPDTAPYTALEVTTIPRPQPKEHEVLIRITHVSLQQVDLLFARGKHQNNNAKHGHVHPPFILGMEFAGEVVETVPARNATTTSTTALFVGDIVMGQRYGAFAEYMCLPSQELRKKPSNLSPAAAASLVGGAVSYVAVRSIAKVKAGETILVTGANGGLGAVACQVATCLGAKVIGLVSSSDKAEVLRSQLGLEHVVVRSEGSDWVEQVKRLCQGGGVEAIIDNIGLVKDGLRCLKFGGRIVMVGFAGRGGVMEEVAMNRILLKGASVIGYRFGQQGKLDGQFLQRAWREYDELLSSGNIKALIDPQPYQGIKDIPGALQDLAERKPRGRVVVAIEQGGNIKL